MRWSARCRSRLTGGVNVDAPRVHLLTMRQFEKDYMLTADPAYLDKFDAAMDTFLTTVEQSWLPEDVKAKVVAQSGEFASFFRSWGDATSLVSASLADMVARADEAHAQLGVLQEDLDIRQEQAV